MDLAKSRIHDAKKLDSLLEEMANRDRDYSVLEILFEHRQKVVDALKAGATAMELHGAFKEIGVKISYNAFARAVKKFKEGVGITALKNSENGHNSNKTHFREASKSNKLALLSKPGVTELIKREL